MAVDGLGNPVRWILTGAEVHDSTQAQALIEGLEAQSVLANKGYDFNEFALSIQERQMRVVIPPKRNRIEQREYDKSLYTFKAQSPQTNKPSLPNQKTFSYNYFFTAK